MMSVAPEKTTNCEAPLQLVLFVDKRPSAREQIRQIRSYLQQLRTESPFELQIVDVGEQPHLAEHFKLVATPALIKIHPEPKQTLAGSNLIAELQKCWSRWQISVEDYQSHLKSPACTPDETSCQTATRSLAETSELMRLSDEIFRLKQEKEELRDRLRYKDQILAMLAHDLRNPLTAASIALETLELSQDCDSGMAIPVTPALKAQLLKHARSQTRAIERLIADILDAARRDSSQLSIQPQKLNIGALCQNVLDDLLDRFQAKSQHLETDIPSDLPSVYADPDWVRQVMVNLLDNAIKYTPNGGIIEVCILHRTTHKVQVSVCDNGPGIPHENQERIFEDHFRLERDKMKDGYGIGLGLCRKVIRLHYGQIWVDSAPNKGSSFHFTLPVHLF